MKNSINHYSKLIPNELIAEYELDYVILSTFTLQQVQLHELLYEIGALGLIPEGRVHVFYDKSARDGNDTTSAVISEKYLHGISIEMEEHLYAFHPKVYVLRYISKQDREQIRYVVIVSSKNISTANLLDAYSVAYGDVSEISNVGNNGEKLAAFMRNIWELSSAQIEENIMQEYLQVCEELQKVNFVLGDNSAKQIVRFYEAAEVWNTIKNKEELTIISPFLSESLVDGLFEKIKILVSSEQGFVKLNEDTIKKLLESGKARLYSGNLHAKIFSWKDDKVNYIIGSSNATTNGCNMYAKSLNVEYNMGFSGKEIENVLENLPLKSFRVEDYKIWRKIWEESEGVSFRNYYTDFIKTLIVKCERKEDSTGYKIELVNSQNKIETTDFKIECKVGEEFFPAQNSQWSFLSYKPVSTIKIKVSNKKASREDENEVQERIFSFSIYDKWNDNEKTAMDAQCDMSYIKLLAYIQKQIIEGKKSRSIHLRDSQENDTKIAGRYSVDKIFVHEELIKLAQVKPNEEEFMAALQELQNLADNILKVDEGNKKQMQLKQSIHKIIALKG